MVGLFIFSSLFVLAYLEITENLNVSILVRILVLLSLAPTLLYQTTLLVSSNSGVVELLNTNNALTRSFISLPIYLPITSAPLPLISFLLLNLGVVILWFKSSLNPRYHNFLLLWINITCLVYGWRTLYLLAVFNLKLFIGVSSIFFVTDTTAYLGGRYLGRRLIKRDLATRISPQKTWEGAITGYLAGLGVAILTFSLSNLALAAWEVALISALLPLLVIIGDLAFSLLKRRLLLVNFSDIIPGHGGINDRFDGAYYLLTGLTLLLTLLQ